MGQQESRVGKIARLQGRRYGQVDKHNDTLKKDKSIYRRDSQPLGLDGRGERAPLLPTVLQHRTDDLAIAITESSEAHAETTRKRLANGHALIYELKDARTRNEMPQAQLKMFAATGAIGTGLFLGLGRALQVGGPLGALLGYAVVGLVVCAVQHALGEVSALYPVNGAFITHAEMLIDDSLGFALGWNAVYGHMISVPAGITAILVLLQTFTTKYVALFTTIMVITTAFPPGLKMNRVYSTKASHFNKIFLVVAANVLAIIIDLGCIPGIKPYGFRYWHYPGPFVDYLVSGPWGKFVGFWTVINIAIYSFAGIEDVTIAGSETKHPRQNIPKACRKAFSRVTCLFLLTIFVIGLLVPSNDPDLIGNQARSPFTIVTDRLGYRFISSVITLMMICVAWSAATASMFNGLRILNELSARGHSPQELKLTMFWAGVLVQTAVAALSYTALRTGPLDAFYYFVNMVAAETVISWIVILLNHIRLRQACIEQGVPQEHLPWHYWWTTYSSHLALVACFVFLLTGGFTVFLNGHWDIGTFIAAYFDIPLFLILYLGRKYLEKTDFVLLDEIPIREILDEISKNPEEPLPAPRRWEKLNLFWG